MKKLLTISQITFVAAWITGLMTATNSPKPERHQHRAEGLQEPIGTPRSSRPSASTPSPASP